jgi:serine/threonine protein kinase
MAHDTGDVTAISDSDRKYTLHEKLGEGMQGIVFKTRGFYDIEEEEGTCAIKFSKDNNSVAALRRMKREATLMKQTGSPYVVDLVDHHFGESDPYLVVEYVPQTLDNLLRNQIMNQSVVMNLVRQIPEMLNIFIERGVVHLDLKPANIGYSSFHPGEEVDLEDYDSCYVVALDFGLAKPLTVENSLPLGHVDEPTHYSPEYRERGEINKVTDTYAMGKVLGWSIAGTQANTLIQVMSECSKIHGNSPPPSFLNMYSKMTKKDPAQRPGINELKDLASKTLSELKKETFFYHTQNQYSHLQYDEPTSSQLMIIEDNV